MKQYTRVLARVNLDAVEYNIEMMKKNIYDSIASTSNAIGVCALVADKKRILNTYCYGKRSFS